MSPTRGRGETRYCPLASCERVVRAGHLLCPVHWRTVPKPLRDDVWAAWRSWTRDSTDAAWDAYATARTTALDHVGETRP